MIKVVLNTNIIISGILWSLGNPRAILYLFQNDEIKVICSMPLFEEIIRTLNKITKRYKLPKEIIEDWFYILEQEFLWVNKLSNINVCRDPDDNMVIATAVAGKAKFIVTGDKDLLVLGKYKGVEIVSAKEFLEFAKNDRAKLSFAKH